MLTLGNSLGMIPQTIRPRILLLMPLLLLLAVSCSSKFEEAIISNEQKSGGPEYSGVVITQDIAVGINRLLFVVLDREGMPVTVKGNKSNVDLYFLGLEEDSRELRGSVTADLATRTDVTGGIFSTEIDVDESGIYQIDITFTSDDDIPIFAQANILVKKESETPAIGSAAPPSVTYTLNDKKHLSHITSAREPDPDLYQLSINDALKHDKPVVIVFATPAFCVSATCGPQVGELTKVKETLGGQANFIHVEVYEDPHLIEGDRPTMTLIPAVAEWNLPTEPWTCIVDKNGLISAKFEQFTTADEIKAKLLEIL